ncbi:3-oxoacyl-ACP synthase [Planosporangium thailandense]|uniref:3-oxoacyl-ACP synthase n=1 Tax=Planosporangium thailandense TaxID=765197 RepID=A0ABX0XXB8_9ACTN|nr:beta-ketoacyl synthase N-terminal-like domain-containing protein [Planosporangium thailandense]NJC70671.1 3-oxoacyl-ACP synthase [Planosporangium thailandense]
MTVVMVGAATVLPSNPTLAELATPAHRVPGPADPGAHITLRGLRYKDHATRLALAAAQVALVDARMWDGDRLTVDGNRVAVVVSSNYGNADTVCRAVETIARESTAGTSPMDLPNTSSNVVASSVAIRFGLRGANVMLCNGLTSGLDALFWARMLVRTGRAAQVLAVGVEPDNAVVRRLTGDENVLDGAAAVVVEHPATARERRVPARARYAAYERAAGVDQCLSRLARHASAPAAWYAPEPSAAGTDVLTGLRRHDLARVWGQASGALGVLQCAAAVGHFDGGGAGPVYLVNGGAPERVTAGVVLDAPGAVG